MLAYQENNVDCVKILLDAGADVGEEEIDEGEDDEDEDDEDEEENEAGEGGWKVKKLTRSFLADWFKKKEEEQGEKEQGGKTYLIYGANH